MANLTQTTSEVQAILDNAKNLTVEATTVKIGIDAGLGSTGNSCVAIGTNALKNTNSAIETVAIGYNALSLNDNSGGGDEGLYNTAVGANALKNNTSGHHNTALGWQALKANTIGIGNTGFGEDALFSNTIGTNNCAIGTHSGLYMTQGHYNTTIGSNSLSSQTIADGNTCMGYSALKDLTTGSNNVAIGRQAGGMTPWSNNPTTDSLCVMIGYQNTTYSGGPFTNGIGIGYQAFIRSSNAAYIGNNAVANCYFGKGTTTDANTKLWFGKLNLSDIPTSSDGLSSGDVWSNGNILTIVP